jgi:hypothetical protein
MQQDCFLLIVPFTGKVYYVFAEFWNVENLEQILPFLNGDFAGGK